MADYTLDSWVANLIEAAGSVRIAARIYDIDYAYLHKLATGKKKNPSPATLKKLGLLPNPLILYTPRKNM